MATCIFPTSEVVYAAAIKDGVVQLLGRGNQPISSSTCYLPRNATKDSIKTISPFKSMEQDLPFSFALFGPGLDGRLVRVLKSACSVTAQQKANGDIQYVHNGRTIDVETVVNTVFSNIVSKVRDAQGSIRTLGFVVPDHFSVLRRAALFRMVKGNLLNEDVKVKLVNQSATIAASFVKHVPEKCNMLIVRIDTEGLTVSIYSIDRKQATPVISVSDTSVTEVDVLKATLDAFVRRVESAGLAPEFKKMDENMRIRKECRYLEIIRSLYAMTNEDATIELSDGKEEEIGEDDCGEAVRSLVAPVFNMIENCVLLSNMSLAMINGIVVSGCTTRFPAWTEALKQKYRKEVTYVSDSDMCCEGVEMVSGMVSSVKQCSQAAYSVGLDSDQVLCIPSGTCFPSSRLEKKCALTYTSGVSSKDLLVLEQRFGDKSPRVVDRKNLNELREGVVYQLQVTMNLDENGFVITDVKRNKTSTEL